MHVGPVRPARGKGGEATASQAVHDALRLRLRAARNATDALFALVRTDALYESCHSSWRSRRSRGRVQRFREVSADEQASARGRGGLRCEEAGRGLFHRAGRLPSSGWAKRARTT